MTIPLKNIQKVLIANRGEIALRVMRTCREMDIKTVTLHSEFDKNLPHALLADESYSLGNGNIGETYLNKEKILSIAKSAGANAIHPGYGFLSENADFCKRVSDAGIVFIGPKPETMKLMGDKAGSKQTLEKIGIPLIPGYHGDNQDDNFLFMQAQKIGFPILIKASAGGGGKGMRVVYKNEEFFQSLESAKREALSYFGDNRVLIEKYLVHPRHIEVQVMSDAHDNHYHFFERECSIQRRHQKIIEETPSSAISSEQRKYITGLALKITKHIQYLGAGTIEFIYDNKENFYFLEMNTRLQVEHPITEMVTGYDLVKLQILAAQGKKLDLDQNKITQKGHAIETRICAENPENDFLPTVGHIYHIGYPQVQNSRFECGYSSGNEVTVHYDPMLAKLIVWGENRSSTIKKMIIALQDTVFSGIITNNDFLIRVLQSKHFLDGNTFTDLIAQYSEDFKKQNLSDNQAAVIIAAYLLAEKKSQSQARHDLNFQKVSVWEKLSHFRNC